MRRDVRESRNLFVAYSLGMLSVGLAYLAFLLSHVRLNDLLESLRLMMGDPEHAQTSLVLRIKPYAKAILKSSSLAGPGMVAMVLLGLVGRFREGLRPPLLLVAWAVALAMQASFPKFYINYCMFPVSMVGLMLVLAWGESSEVSRVFWGIWLPGVVYGLCIHFSLNQAFYAISSAMTVSAVASVVLTGIALGDLDHVDRVDRLTSGAVVVCVLANVLLLVALRYSSVFWERSMQDQVALATSGPERGVLMTKEKLRAYEADLADVAQLNAICPDGTLLCYSEHTWLYLVSPTHSFATYSAWLSGLSDTTIKRLGAYYKLHPQKVPDVIYVERQEDVPALCDMLVGRRYEEVALGHGSSVLVGTAHPVEG